MNLARPIYHSSATNSYGTWGFGFSLDNLDGLYSTVFTEVNDSDAQAHAFLRIAAESSHRNALGARNGVPPMCLFYPKTAEESLFCWAFTKLMGQNYWGTSHEYNPAHEEMMSKICNFEKLHPEIYEKPESVAEIGVMFSAKTVILHKDNDTEQRGGMSDPASTDCWAGWCEVLTLAGMPYITLVEKDIQENKIPSRIKLLIVPNITCVSDDCIKNIKQFVEKGGNLIITHQSGIKDSEGGMRTSYPFIDLVGAEYTGQTVQCSEWKNISAILSTSTDMENNAFFCAFKLHKAELIYTVQDNASNKTYPAIFANNFGKGKVVTFAYKPGRLVCINRHKKLVEGETKFVEINFSMDKNITSIMLATVKNLYQDPFFSIMNLPNGVICGVFRTKSDYVIHLLNIAGILQDDGKRLPFPPPVIFPDFAPAVYKIHLKRKFKSAVILSTENKSITDLTMCSTDDETTIEIPSSFIKSYSVIKIN